MASEAAARRGFSLVEMIVAMGLLGVLLLVGLAGWGRVSERSREARCLHHLRATGLAALHFLTDRDGAFFPTKYWYSRLSTAASPGMRDYLGSTSTAKSNSPVYHVDSVLTCPKLKSDCPAKFPSMLNRCFSMNVFLIALDPNKPDDLEAGENPGSPQRLNRVPAPSRMWAFTDGTTTDPGGPGEFGTVVSHRMVSDDRLLYPHEGYQHVVFLDGHVERLSREMFRAPSSRREFWGDLTQP